MPEVTRDKFPVTVAVTIFVRSVGDGNTPSKCAFYDQGGTISLPTASVTATKHANQVVIDLIKDLIPVDIRQLNIMPFGFFDPITDDGSNPKDREIILGYRVIILPGTPIKKELEFKDHEELGISHSRISKNHFRVFRAGLYS